MLKLLSVEPGLGLPETSHLFPFAANVQGELLRDKEEDLRADLRVAKMANSSGPSSLLGNCARSEVFGLSFPACGGVTLPKANNTLQLQRKFPFRCLRESTKKRPHPEAELNSPSSSDLGEKIKLERNRISARECRMRKKIYVTNLEEQIKNLKKELQECRRELSGFKQREEHHLFGQLSIQDLTQESFNPLSASPDNKKLRVHIVTAYVKVGRVSHQRREAQGGRGRAEQEGAAAAGERRGEVLPVERGVEQQHLRLRSEETRKKRNCRCKTDWQ
eukprot:TRINITY_DN5800_c0_g1_i1.p1 TRINITY_DN5800_c0_g1~~TRINITY_DN5800_c0_g1_i1.p1  ORF type:complete len:276 (-),score=45.90 TRINITY_DN5800_c0_g1_i1:81-908(-)